MSQWLQRSLVYFGLLCLNAIGKEANREYLLDIWGTDDGLPSTTVTGIAQAPDGYLWCSTHDGVVRFDGVRFLRIGSDDPANEDANRVLCVHADRRGQLWMGTDGAGLFRYGNGQFARFAEPSAAANCIRAIAEDNDGNLWLGTRGGLGRFRDGRTQWFTSAQGYSNAVFSVWNLAFDREGRLWTTDWVSLKSFKDDVFETASVNPERRPPLRALYSDAMGNVWAGMMGQAWELTGDDQWRSLPDVDQFARQEVSAFCKTRAGEFWIGTRRALYRWTKGGWESFPRRDGQAFGEVRVMFEDREENLWVGTGTDGLARLKPRLVRTYTARHGLVDGPILALREQADGRLWVGMNNGQIAYSQGSEFKSFTPAHALFGDAPVKSILCTRDGALWVGTFGNGVARFKDGTTTQFRPLVGTLARIDKVNTMLEDRHGDVWIGSYYTLYRATQTNVLAPVLVDGREVRAPVTTLLEDRAGGLWVAFDGMGLARLQDGTTFWLSRREGLPTHFIRALHEDRAGTLWIGTPAGLCAWRGGKLTVFNTSHGLEANTISQILEDDAGNLWLGSGRGIMRVPVRDLLAVAAGEKASLDVFLCGQRDGMISEESSFSLAGLKARDGKLWFPTSKGLVMVDPQQLGTNLNVTPPPVYIEEMRADGKLMPTARANTHSIVLPAATRRLEFIYTALSFAAPERIRFKHRLDGFDSDWTDAGGSRRAIYSKLPPGQYKFQVIACNNAGVWNMLGQSFDFRIAAPFWKTWWFFSLVGLTSAGMLGAGIRFVSLRKIRRKLQRLEEAHAIEKERMRIAQDMHDELGAKLSRISFLSDMVRRNVPETSPATQQMEEVSDASRDVIRTVDEIVWAVSPRNDSLESLAHYICRHAEEFFEFTPIELELKLPDEFPQRKLSADIRHNLFCAVKEALTNVLKHSQATRVQIEFAVREGAFEVTVTDNGQGFAVAVPASAGRTGNGLTNMHERLASISGRLAVHTRPGQGARLVFTVSY
jgi:ligand-binding sensor domain-containing protein/signal transduction histidine kinase